MEASRVDILESLKSAGRGSSSSRERHRAVNALVTIEMALSVVLLVGAALLMESVLRMGSAPLGFNPDHLIIASTTLPADRYGDAANRIRFYEEVNRRIGRLPGVQGVALSSSLPPFSGSNDVLRVEGRPVTPGSELHDVSRQAVSPEYFHVLGVQLLRGRTLDVHDGLDFEEVAVVNQALARQYFAGTDPIGKRIRVGDEKDRSPWLTIVGVVANEKHTTVYQEMNLVDRPVVFRPIMQDAQPSFSIAVRTVSDQASIGAEIQREISAVDSSVPASIDSMRERMSRFLAYPRFRAALFSAFAAFALLLAAFGLHGVLGQFVVNRTQEIGVRIAVGAQTRDVLLMVAKQGGAPALAGLGIGLLCAVGLGRYLSSLLYGVRATDPLTIVAVSLTLLATAAIAIWIPARRAARLDPMVALRYE